MDKIYLLNISLLLVLFSGGNAHAQTTSTTSPDVPKNLQVPQDQSFILKAAAKGSQIYFCKAKPDNPNSFEWTLKAPSAVLFNEEGERLGKHYAGPTWESNDGSKVIGQKEEGGTFAGVRGLSGNPIHKWRGLIEDVVFLAECLEIHFFIFHRFGGTRP